MKTYALLGFGVIMSTMFWHAVYAAEENVEAIGGYPVDTCIVSGKKLGSMGDPYIYVYEGRTVQFCCKGCIDKFDKKADQYLKKLDKMIIEAQLSDYPLEVCVVSGESLEEWGDPVNVVYNNRLVRFCCDECVKDFLKEPHTYLEKLDKGITPEKSTSQQHDHDKSPAGHDHGHQHHGHSSSINRSLNHGLDHLSWR